MSLLRGCVGRARETDRESLCPGYPLAVGWENALAIGVPLELSEPLNRPFQAGYFVWEMEVFS